MQNEEMMKMFQTILDELEKSTNPELKDYATKLKEIMYGVRKEEKEEGKVDEPKKGRIIEVACDMNTVSA